MRSTLRHALFIFLCFLFCPIKTVTAGLPGDLIQANSVWKSDLKHQLIILERQGEKFRAFFTWDGKGKAEIFGEIKGNKISWLAKDARVINGDPGGDNAGTIKDDRIDFTWRRRDNGMTGAFTLVWVSGPAPLTTPPASMAPTPIVAPLMIETDANDLRIEVLKDQGPNAIEWAMAPLDLPLPADIRQNLTLLREDLLDEGNENPGLAAAYKAGSEYCDRILDALDQRDLSRANAGYAAAQADAAKRISNQQLDARRSHQMSWPQFQREEAQRAALREQQNHVADARKERLKAEWTGRAVKMRSVLDDLYKQFREALRAGQGTR